MERAASRPSPKRQNRLSSLFVVEDFDLQRHFGPPKSALGLRHSKDQRFAIGIEDAERLRPEHGAVQSAMSLDTKDRILLPQSEKVPVHLIDGCVLLPLADRIGLLDSAWRLLPDVAREEVSAATRLKAELQALVGPEGPSRELLEDWKKRFPPPHARATRMKRVTAPHKEQEVESEESDKE